MGKFFVVNQKYYVHYLTEKSTPVVGYICFRRANQRIRCVFLT